MIRFVEHRTGRIFERVSPYRALLPFLFCQKRYLQLAIQHNMAVNLQSQDILEAFRKGVYPKEGWESEALANAKEAATHVRRAIWVSFLMVAATSLIAIAIAGVLGSISANLPTSLPRVLGLLGKR
jgi:hypothetical protein